MITCLDRELYNVDGNNAEDDEIEEKEFISEGKCTRQKLTENISEEMVENIIENISPAIINHSNDKVCWIGNSKGTFKVKSS